MKKLFIVALLTSVGAVPGLGKDVEKEFFAYVDSDLCAHLRFGPIDASRVKCTQDTHKQGSNLVLLEFADDTILDVHKEKKIKKLAGQSVKVKGKVDEKQNRVKIETVEAIAADKIPREAIGPMMDVRNYRTKDQGLFEKIRHELAMLPYLSVFDFVSFTLAGSDVILTGWTIRTTNRSGAYKRVKRIEGIGHVTNNIELLPLGSFDMQIRAGTRAALQRFLARYFWDNGSTIRIVVKHGDIILLGTVSTEADKNVANIQSRGVPGAFHVFNMLRVVPSKKSD